MIFCMHLKFNMRIIRSSLCTPNCHFTGSCTVSSWVRLFCYEKFYVMKRCGKHIAKFVARSSFMSPDISPSV